MAKKTSTDNCLARRDLAAGENLDASDYYVSPNLNSAVLPSYLSYWTIDIERIEQESSIYAIRTLITTR